MYSWEINNVMHKYNFVLPHGVYKDIIHGSPQLTYLGYDMINDLFDLYDSEGNQWKFEIQEEATWQTE